MAADVWNVGRDKGLNIIPTFRSLPHHELSGRVVLSGADIVGFTARAFPTYEQMARNYLLRRQVGSR